MTTENGSRAKVRHPSPWCVVADGDVSGYTVEREQRGEKYASLALVDANGHTVLSWVVDHYEISGDSVRPTVSQLAVIAHRHDAYPELVEALKATLAELAGYEAAYEGEDEPAAAYESHTTRRARSLLSRLEGDTKGA